MSSIVESIELTVSYGSILRDWIFMDTHWIYNFMCALNLFFNPNPPTFCFGEAWIRIRILEREKGNHFIVLKALGYSISF